MIKQTAVFALLALQASSPVFAWSWARNAPAATTTPLLQWLAQSPDGTLWGADSRTLHRLSVEGEAASAGMSGQLQITPTGQVLQRMDGSNGYTLTGYGADLLPRWQAQRSNTSDVVRLGTDGTTWLSNTIELQLLDTYGRNRGLALPPAWQQPLPHPIQRAALTGMGDGMLLPGPITSDSQELQLTLRDNQGAQRWQWSGSGQPSYLLSRDGSTPDGDILVVSRESPQPDFSRSVIARLSAAGVQRWCQAYDDIPPGVQKVVWRSDGGVHLIYRAPGGTTQRQPWRLASLDRAGTLLWTREIVTLANNAPATTLLDLHSTADGTAIALWSDDSTRGLRRYAADGSTSATVVALPFARIGASTLTRDGRLLASVVDTSAGLSHLVELAQDGSNTAFARPWPRRTADSNVLASQTMPDGSSYVLTSLLQEAYPSRYSLSRIGADGSVLWQHVGEGSLSSNYKLTADVTRACIGGGVVEGVNFRQHVACHAVADGVPLWSQVLQLSAISAHDSAMRLLGDGRLIVLYNRSLPAESTDTTEHIVFGTAGNMTSQRSLPGRMRRQSADIDPQGRATYVRQAINQYLDLTRLEDDGSIVYTRTPEQLGFYPERAQALDDGSVLLSNGPGGNSVRVMRLDAGGNAVWTRPLLQSCFPRFLYAPGALYTYCRQLDEAGKVLANQVERLDLADGSVKWTRELPVRTPGINGEPALAGGLASDDRSLVLAQEWNGKLRLVQLDTAAGSVLRDEYQSCAGDYCTPLQVSLAPDSLARILVRRPETDGSLTATLYATPLPAVPPAPTRLDQPGVSGAWWSPYANGEGIVLDWFPAQRTLFGAWFTYTTAGGNDPAQLRWYTIQAGNVAANATSVQLPILETTGGNFDAGPPASPVPVGMATLNFTDCDNATLGYAFDAGHNDGVTGTITLSRLTPATESCTLADGSTRPGAGAKPPQDGFDARMSGTWFEEATSGQGLQFTVQPGGVFFAPWFTYDPQGQGNDANREHWFTLQGNLANATNGRAEVVIAQSLGGAFDRIPTYNGFAVGKATVTMTACGKARVDYRFDDNELAGSFRKRSGTLELSKIGGCSP